MAECPHRGMKREPNPWHYCRIESDLPYAIWLCEETHKAGYEDCAVYQRARAEAAEKRAMAEHSRAEAAESELAEAKEGREVRKTLPAAGLVAAFGTDGFEVTDED